MKKIFPFLLKLLEKIESSPTTFSLWAGAFLAIIGTRLLIESWLGNFNNHSFSFLFTEFAHTFLFFLLSYILFLWLLIKATHSSLIKLSNILLWGFLIILTPPIIDYGISHGSGFWSFYKFDGLEGLWLRFLTFFGDAPNIGITYGVRIEIALSLVFFFLYIFTKTKKFFISLTWTIFAYILFFFLGTFPSWITFLTRGFLEGPFSISATDIAQMFLTPERILSQFPSNPISVLNTKMSILYGIILSLGIPLLGVLFFPQKTFALLKNMRIPQVFYHGGLVCVGAGLSILFSERSFLFSFFDITAFCLLLIAVGFSWFTSVIVNDLFDTNIDTLTNPQRPLIQNIFSKNTYKIFGWIFFFSSLFLAGIVLPIASLMLIFYQGLAWLYSAPPFRLKRFPIIATSLSAIASLLLLFMGYMAMSPTGSLEHIPQNIILLLFIGYALSIPIKDLKDIAGDKRDGVFTIPVLFGETKGRLFIASGIFFSFILSIWTFNDFFLTPWAILFGAISFWIIATSHKWKRYLLPSQYLPFIILALVALYGFVIASRLLHTL